MMLAGAAPGSIPNLTRICCQSIYQCFAGSPSDPVGVSFNGNGPTPFGNKDQTLSSCTLISAWLLLSVVLQTYLNGLPLLGQQ